MSNPRIDLLYLGVREGPGAQMNFLWYDLTGIANDGSQLKEEAERHQVYGARKKGQRTASNIAFASPGQLFSFEKSEGGVYRNSHQYLGRWQNQEDVIRWQAESNAIARTIELAQRSKKEAKDRLDWEALEPFRQAYHRQLNYKQQQMLLAQILHCVTRHKRED
jgi:hypothetical protein